MKKFTHKKQTFRLRVNWRSAWYATILWIMAVVASGFVILPWYYLALPLVIFSTTIVYFHKGDKTFSAGLWCGIFWFFTFAILDFFQVVGPYYSNASLYFSDVRNILKYPLILLVPVIYSLVMETKTNRVQPSIDKPLEIW
ncbi:MAG TPA: hypothetical protein VLE91_01760 [Candidatus Saccharimonadales bacterium]|nr:hypothetical protein [Candidatus Saccharimonadales bacterium]